MTVFSGSLRGTPGGVGVSLVSGRLLPVLGTVERPESRWTGDSELREVGVSDLYGSSETGVPETYTT